MAKKSCVFNVIEGVGTDVDGYSKDDVLSSCSCVGAEKVKGKGYLLSETMKIMGEAGKGIAEVCGAIVIGGGTVALCVLVPEIASITLPIGGGAALGVGAQGFKTIKHASHYGDLHNKLPSCIKQSWSKTRSVDLDWNGLSDINELEGLNAVEHVSARFNNLKALPDLNKMPALKSIDLSFAHLPPFTCSGIEWKSPRKLGLDKINEIRKCQRDGLLVQSTR